MTSFYFLTHGSGRTRNFPFHGFTPKTITEKRFKENTTPVALSYNILLPFLNRVNKSVEEHIDKATDVTTEEFVAISKDAAVATAKSFVDVTARVTVQTGLACVLITAKSPLADSIVYSWDMYPRLHRKYVGDLLQKLYLPRFLATLLGPETHAPDLAVFQVQVSPLAALEDSLKRHVVYVAADVVVDTGRALLEAPNKGQQIVNRITVHATTLLAKAVCAAGGRAVKRDAGEYWGEYVGAFLGSFLAAKILIALRLQADDKNKKQ